LFQNTKNTSHAAVQAASKVAIDRTGQCIYKDGSAQKWTSSVTNNTNLCAM